MVKLATTSNYISKAFDFTHSTITQIQIQQFKICQTTINFNHLLVHLMKNMNKGQWEICKKANILPQLCWGDQVDMQEKRGYQFSEGLGLYVQTVDTNRTVRVVLSILDTLNIRYSITVGLRRERTKNATLTSLVVTLSS